MRPSKGRSLLTDELWTVIEQLLLMWPPVPRADTPDLTTARPDLPGGFCQN